MKKTDVQTVEVSGSRRSVRAIGIAVLVGIVALIVSYGAMTVGYVLVVVALSAFFLMVAFDIGVPKQSSDIAGD